MTKPTSARATVRPHRNTVDEPSTYRLDVAGHLHPHWSDWLGDVDMVHNDDATTTMTVAVVDQAQLHGLLGGIRDIGAPLLSLERVPTRSSSRAETVDTDPIAVPALSRVLHTDRLRLRPATTADTDPTWSYRRLESVNEWLTGPLPSKATYREQFEEASRLTSTVIVELRERDGGGLIGDFMLRRADAWAQAPVAEQARDAQVELGWVLDPAHTGAGYATEAVRELLRHCFEDLHVHRAVANCFLDNEASWRIMERVGMRREGHAVAESLHRSGRWLDTVTYAALAADWRGADR